MQFVLELEKGKLVFSRVVFGRPFFLKAPTQSVHVDEASKQVRKFVEHGRISSHWNPTLVFASLLTATCTVVFILRNILQSWLFLSPSLSSSMTSCLNKASLANDYGISSSICENPQKIGEFIEKLNVIIRQENPLVNPTPIERMWWESGQDFRRLAPSEWCNES
jgi:hypothetical protein